MRVWLKDVPSERSIGNENERKVKKMYSGRSSLGELIIVVELKPNGAIWIWLPVKKIDSFVEEVNQMASREKLDDLRAQKKS